MVEYLHTYQFILSPSPVNPGLGVVGVQLKESVEVLCGSGPHPVEKIIHKLIMFGCYRLYTCMWEFLLGENFHLLSLAKILLITKDMVT